MPTIKATNSMIQAVRGTSPSERQAAKALAERVFREAFLSPVIADAKDSETARQWAGAWAAAEVSYRFS